MWDEEGGEGITYRLYMPPTHPTWSNFGFRFFSYKLVRCIWECAVDAKYFFSTPSSVTTQLYYHLLHFVENRFELMIHSNEIFFA